MSNGSKVSVINAIKTPLGFFTLVVLILEAFTLYASAVTREVTIWVPLGLLGLVVGLVFAVTWKKPWVLYDPRTWRTVDVALVFPAKPIKVDAVNQINVDLDIKNCKLVIYDREGKRTPKGTPNLTFSRGGWVVKLGEYVGPFESVGLELVEHSGRTWKVKSFSPFDNQREAELAKQTEV